MCPSLYFEWKTNTHFFVFSLNDPLFWSKTSHLKTPNFEMLCDHPRSLLKLSALPRYGWCNSYRLNFIFPLISSYVDIKWFYIVLSNSALQPSFRDEWASIVTTFVMTLGEINKADLLDTDEPLHPFTDVAYVLVVLFLFLMPMVLINLTVSLTYL